MAIKGIKEIALGNNNNYLIEPTLYTTVNQTSAATTFTADLDKFELFNGVTVAVKFGANVTNNASATLNINETGAKAIYYEGVAIAASKLKAKHTYTFTYNGTQWELVGDLDTNTQREYGTTTAKIGTSAAGGNASTVSRSDHVHAIDLATGDSNGQIKIAGTNISVKGLGDRAFDSTEYLPKITYEFNKEIPFGSSGKLLIGKFPCYDSNVTIEIFSTTSITYHAVAILATQNINTSGGGTITWNTYGDSANTVTPNLFAKYVSGSRNIEIYFSPAAWSKNYIHIACVALNAAPTNICENITDIPSDATRKPTNTLLSISTTGDAGTVNEHTVLSDVPENAVFTDTNKYHKSGSWSGLTYTATAVNNADELKFTIPDNYGDTKNPYASKTKNYVLAAPNGSAGVPSFRALVAADIPALAYVPATSGANDVNTLVNTGIYNITSGSATNTPKNYGYGNLITLDYRKHSGNTTTDWASQIYLHSGSNNGAASATAPGNVLYYRTSNASSWLDWQQVVHTAASYTKIGDTNKPVYIAEDGTATAISYTIEKSVPSNAVFTDTNKYHKSGSWGGTNNLTYTATAVNSADALAFTLATATNDAFGVIKIGNGITNTNGVISVSASNLGLSNAMHFIGIATQTITDGGTEDPTISGYSTKTAGDVVIDKDTRREYVWSTANKWEMLGFDASTTYSKTTSGNTFISSISQATDGTVTAESRALDTSGTWSGTATNATYTSYIKSPDTRATEIVPQDLNANSTGVRFDFKQKSVTSLKANYSGVMSYRPYSHDSDWSCGPAHQLAFDENGIHWRKSTNSTTWGSWNQLVTITDQTAVGNATQPIYIDDNGVATACATTTVSNAWSVASNDTTKKIPMISTTVNGVTGTAVAIPEASTSAGGIVTIGTQSFGGSKTFIGDTFEIRADVIRLRNKSNNNNAVTNQPYVTSLIIGDSRYINFTEYKDDHLVINSKSILLDTTSNGITAYDPSKTYSLNAIVWYDRSYYYCSTAITEAEAWNSAHWTAMPASNIMANASFVPWKNNSYALGSSSYRWSKVYIGTADSYGNDTTPIYWNNGVPKACTSYANASVNHAASADSATSATSATSLTNFVVSTYSIPATKGVRIQYPTYAPVLISVQRSNTGGRLILIGGGYGANATTRNDFTELVSPSTSYFTWSLPDSSSISNSIEIMNHASTEVGTVVVWSKGACVFTEISALTSDATNHTLLHSSNYSSYALPLSGGTMTGTITLHTTGLKTSNTGGYTTDQYGNFKHQSTTASNTWNIVSNAGANNFSVNFENGNTTAAGTITAAGFSGPLTGNATSATVMGKGTHTAAVTANEFSDILSAGMMTLVGNVSNTSMPKTNNANAELIIKTHPTSGTNYYEARLGFSSNGALYYMPVNSNTWKQVVYTDGSISGNAATATIATYLGNIGRQTNMDVDFGTTTYNSKVFISYADGSTTTNKPPSNAIVFNIAWDNINNNHYGAQMALSNADNTHIYLRGCSNGTWDSNWKTVLDSNNYSSYALPLSGGTMTGQIVLASSGYKTSNTAGYSVDQYGNFKHQTTTATNTFEIQKNNGTATFKVTFESGEVAATRYVIDAKVRLEYNSTDDSLDFVFI